MEFMLMNIFKDIKTRHVTKVNIESGCGSINLVWILRNIHFIN